MTLDGAEARCWGSNFHGNAGCGNDDGPSCMYGRNGGISSPTTLTGPIRMTDAVRNQRTVQIESGANHTCALLEGGEVRCWGMNAVGQLGCAGGSSESCTYGLANGVGSPSMLEGPVNMTGAADAPPATMIALGWNHSCALLQADDGSQQQVRCWGSNFYGQLGCGSGRSKSCRYRNRDRGVESPAMLDGPIDFGPRYLNVSIVSIVAGGYHTCALFEGGDVLCWGFNENGQLGCG